MQEQKESWYKYILSNYKVFLWVNGIAFSFSVLVWLLSYYYGKQEVFYVNVVTHVEWTIVSLFILSGIYFAKSISTENNFRSKSWITGLAVFIGSLLSGVFFDVFFQVLGPKMGLIFDVSIVYADITSPKFATNSVGYGFAGIILAISSTQIHSLKYKHYLEALVNEHKKKRLEELKNQAMLDALKAKINPHFLYNSLNSVASLIKKDAEKAEEMIISLSELFRYHINSSNSNFSSLENEKEILETYLDIEKIRFGNQLSYSIEIGDASKGIEIPRLLLQPIVENGIKHGTSKVEKGIIIVRISVKKGDIVLEVEDNGPPFSNDFVSGHGLENVIGKLDLLYGENYKLDLISNPIKMVKIILGKKLND